MKKHFTILQILVLLLSSICYPQQQDEKIIINSNLKKLKPFLGSISFEKNITKKLAPSISPTNQTICTGQAITNITSSPNISNTSKLDCYTGGTGTYVNVANNGIFFDITNSGSIPVRINGFDFISFTSVTTASNETVPFTFYKTTSASTAVGNYTDSSAWTSLGSYNWEFPPTAANNGYILTLILNDNGFTLAPGASTGIYIVCDNTNANGFRLGYRTSATTGAPITDTNLTVTHRVRGTGLFQTDSAGRGFYGNVLYNTDTFGYWSRNNTTNVTGSTNAGDTNSGGTPFPISGSLTNTTSTTQIVTYTITSYDVNGVKDVQSVYVNVEPQADNTITVNGNLLTANQNGAMYQWYACEPTETLIPGATSQSYTPPSSIAGYKVRITLGPCEIDSNCTATLSNNSFDLSDKVKVYPIPTKNYFTINSEIDLKGNLYDQLGQKIKEVNIKANSSETINTPELKSGLYFIKGITAENKTISKKILIE